MIDILGYLMSSCWLILLLLIQIQVQLRSCSNCGFKNKIFFKEKPPIDRGLG